MKDKKKNYSSTNLLHEKLNELIPYISQNAITYPLWEEGIYIPFVNFWQKAETKKDVKSLIKRLYFIQKNTCYKIRVENEQIDPKIYDISIYPQFKCNKFHGCEMVSENWSIEEMICLIKDFLKK